LPEELGPIIPEGIGPQTQIGFRATSAEVRYAISPPCREETPLGAHTHDTN